MSDQGQRAVIYARFSTDMQRDASIDDQIRACHELAARRGMTVIDSYSDRATSGASLMRPGIQSLISDAQAGRFDIVVAHALDRLSRNQADIASLYQRLQFSGVAIETVGEGLVDEMHIGLKGTMNALFLKDLAKKTREGLKGRALSGKSAGGKCYGYRNLVHTDAQGERIRGDRQIDDDEARVVRRIFHDYARGISPKKIAEALNLEGIPGPQGGDWGASTIHGNRERGTGILNNELYIGRQIWNRLTYVKDPATGKRVSRLNPEDQWVVTAIPELRLLDQALWEAARARQGAQKSKGTGVAIWDRRRPKFLFSGLMSCGCCGAGFSMVTRDGFGCSAARNKGKAICTNTRIIQRNDLEARVLDALQHHLMDAEAVRIFCEEYAAERNRLNAAADGQRAELERELRRVTRDHARLVDAIIEGVPAEQVRDRMIALDGRRKEIEAALSRAPAADPVRFHPSMAATYRDRVGALIRGLTEPGGIEEAKEALRGLVEKIVLAPDPRGRGLTIDLHGALASLLRLATGMPVTGLAAETQKAPRKAGRRTATNARSASPDLQDADFSEELVLVAGVGFEPTTFRL